MRELSSALVVLVFAALPGVRADTQVLSSILPSSRSVALDEAATVFATVINAGSEMAVNCRIERDPSTLIDFQYGTTNPATNAIDGPLDTPADIPAGAFQTYFFSASAGSPRTAFEFKPRFLCDNAPVVETITGLNSITLAISNQPTPDVIALSATVSADGVTTLPQRVSAAAFSVATTNLGASGSIFVTAELSDAALPATLSMCETNPTSGECKFPSAPTAGPVEVKMDSGSSRTFAFFVNASNDIAFDPAFNRVFVRFLDEALEVRGETSVALRSRLRTPDEPLQVVEVIAGDSAQFALRPFDWLLGLHREVVEGVTLLAQEGVQSISSICESFGRARFTLRDTDNSLTLSVSDVVVGDLEGCGLGFGSIGRGEIELTITTLQPDTAGRWILGGQVEIVEPITSVDPQSTFSLNGGYSFSVTNTGTLISEALVGSENQTLRLTSGDAETELKEFSIQKTTDLNGSTGTVDLAGRLENAKLGGSVECVSETLRTAGEFFSPAEGAFVCTGLNDAKVKLEVSSSQRADLLLDDNGDGQFHRVQTDIEWVQFAGTNLLAPGKVAFLPIPASVTLPAASELSIAVTDLAFSAVSGELVVANSAGLTLLEPETLAVVASLSLPGVVGTMTIAPDSRTLAIGYQDRPEIQLLDVPTRQLQPALSFAEFAGDDPLIAEDIAISPDMPQQVAVALRYTDRFPRHAAVVLFSGTVLLPEALQDPEGPNLLVFSEDGRLFGVSNAAPNNDLQELLRDDSGLSAGVRLENFFDASPQDLALANGHLLSTSRSPTLIDFDAKRINAKLLSRDNAFDSALAVDQTNSRIYYVDSAINTYDTQTFTRLSRAVHSLRDDPTHTVVTSTRLVVAEQARVSTYSLGQLQGTGAATCPTTLNGSIRHFNCNMKAAVYSPQTDQMLVSVGSDAGIHGNSIAFMDAQTAEIQGYVPIGSEPEELSLNSDNSSLSVALRGSNVVARLSLATSEVTYSDSLLIDGNQPGFVRKVSNAPDDPDTLIAALNNRSFNPNEIRRLFDGVQDNSMNPPKVFELRSLAYSTTDPSRAFAVTGTSVVVLNVDALGAARAGNDDFSFGDTAVAADDYLVNLAGQRLNMATLATDSLFAPILSEAVGYDAPGNQVLFLQNEAVVTVHDAITGELLRSFFVPGAEDFSDIPPMFAVSPSGALLTYGEKGAWFIPRSLLSPAG